MFYFCVNVHYSPPGLFVFCNISCSRNASLSISLFAHCMPTPHHTSQHSAKHLDMQLPKPGGWQNIGMTGIQGGCGIIGGAISNGGRVPYQCLERATCRKKLIATTKSTQIMRSACIKSCTNTNVCPIESSCLSFSSSLKLNYSSGI